MNLSKDKKLQIANVLETGKEIPSSVKLKGGHAWSHKFDRMSGYLVGGRAAIRV